MQRWRTIGTRITWWLQRGLVGLILAWQWAQARTAIWLWALFGVLLVGAGAGSALWMFRRQIGTLLDPDTVDFLQVAANVAAGKGLTTFVLRPIGLTPHFSVAPVPDLYHPPLPTILWGAVFALLGRPDDRIAVLLSGTLIGLSAAGLFFMTARLVNRWAALVAVALFLTAPLTLGVGGSAQPIALASALFVLWLILLTQKAVWDKRFALLTGISLGLAGLSSGLTLVAAPVALCSRRWISWRERLWFLAALVLVLLPFGIRNERLTGIPLTPWKAYAFLWDTPLFPGDSILRHAFSSRPSPLTLSLQHAGVIVRKGIANMRRLPRGGSGFGWLVILGALTAPIWWRRWRGSLLRMVTAVTLVTSMGCLALLALTRPAAEALFFLLPPLCLLASANLATWAELFLTTRWWQWLTQPLLRRPYWMWAMGRRLIAALLGTALMAGQGMTGFVFMKRWVPLRWDPAQQALPLAQGLTTAYKGETLLASDEPRLLARYWKRPILWLPCHRQDWERLKLVGKVTHIWLSPTALLQLGGDANTLLRRTVLTGLPFLDRYYPTVVRAPRFLLPTPFLVVGPPADNRPPRDKTLEEMPLDKLLKQAEELQRRKEYAQAERLLLVALRRQPSAQVFWQLGNLWLEWERYPLALQAFQAMLGELPGNFGAANNLAWTYLQLYEQLSRLPNPPPFLGILLASAERWAEHAVAACPNDPHIRAQVLDTAGWVDFLQGRTKAGRGQDRWRLRRALKRLEEAYRLLKDNDLIRHHLATLYTELGMTQKAEQLLSAR